jgi:hypothetical protein
MQIPAADNFWHYLDTGLIGAVLAGIAHLLIKIGAMQTKIDAMWNKYTGDMQRRDRWESQQ